MITLCMSRLHQDVCSVIVLMRKQVEFNFYQQEISNYFKNCIYTYNSQQNKIYLVYLQIHIN